MFLESCGKMYRYHFLSYPIDRTFHLSSKFSVISSNEIPWVLLQMYRSTSPRGDKRHICSFLIDTKPLWHWGIWKSWLANKTEAWPWYRPSGMCSLHRFEATCQFLHSEIGSSQMACGCAWPRYLTLKANTGTIQEIQALNQSLDGCNHRLWIGHCRANKSHILSRGPPTACQNCGRTLTIDHMLLGCAVLQGSRDE